VKITEEHSEVAFSARSGEEYLFFKTLFKQHAAGLLRLAMSQLKSQAEAEEVVQECFLKFWEQRRELGNDPTAAKGYLYTSAYRTILNQLRRQHYWVYQECTESTLTEQEPQSTELEYEELEHLYKVALAQLPPKRRQVFLMSRQQGLSYAAIAKELEVSVKAVEEHMRLALKFLRVYFRAHGITLSLLLLLAATH
jgi:RNA polymerase sigma-70 factor (ECF subfamily)